VILLRQSPSGGDGFEVYAMRRVASMAFAPKMYVFPGGTVDPSDSQTFIDWAGPAPAEWAARLALPVGAAQAVVCAAVRELFEEAGVLLAGDASERVVGDLSDERWETARTELLDRTRSLTGWFAESGLTLRAGPPDAVGPLADAGVRAPPVRHVLLPGPAAVRSAAP
jgi:8-oxo-dGTP pyrophosphatase MutT (NUDIX family)